MKCFYHGDLDGKCAGFWVKEKYSECEMNEINYNQEFTLPRIEEDEKIFIVDFSIDPEEMQELLRRTKNVIWIDHHISAIKKYKDFPFEIKGIRKDGTAGCVLTYNYLYPDAELNMMTVYIGDWDTWTFKYGEDTEYFKMGMESHLTSPDSKIWSEALRNTGKIIEEGKIINRYKKVYYQEYIDNYGFEVEFECHKCIACNAGKASSKLFDSLNKNYDIMMPFVFDGEQYTVSLYSKKVDVSKVAEKYGGGGHTGAAGFICDELPFLK